MEKPRNTPLSPALAPMLALLAAIVIAVLPAPAQVLPGGGDDDCGYDPGENCCQCVYNKEICYEEDKHGGVKYCSKQVCPLGGADRCCAGGVPCSD